MKYIVSIMVILSVLTFASCTGNVLGQSQEVNNNSDQQAQEVSAEYHKISQIEAKEMMDSGVLVIDVREQDEYDGGHITDAILSPVGNIQNDIVNIVDSKDTPILLYCRSGSRSKVASDALVALGYTNVYDFGGINTWAYEVIQ